MKPYPVEYRHRIVALTEKGMSSVEIADVLGVSAAWVRSIKKLNESDQPLQPKSSANNRKSLAEREGERIKARVTEHPGTTLEDLKRDLNLSGSIANIWYALRDLGLSLEKKPSGRPNSRGRMSPSHEPPGTSSKPGSTRVDSSSSTKRSARRR